MEPPIPSPIRGPSTALLECRQCDLSFTTAEAKRQHAKSESHVDKIRSRVADAGSTVLTPSSLPKPPAARRRPRPQSPHAGDESLDEESASDSSSSSDRDIVEFQAEECLFCNHASKDFDDNFSHMQQTHSLTIPFQSSLAVDLKTLIWFLHMVIFSYRECICCGKRRRTVEAVQHHMTSMGHCRFDVTDEMSGFYDMNSLGEQTAASSSHPDEHTLRLPSGKLLAHRAHTDSASRSRPRERSPPAASSPGLAAPEQGEASTSSLVLTRRERKRQAVGNELAQLRTGDQMSLTHLPESQQRALLVAQKKELDKAKRAERRARGRMDNVGNKTAVHTKYYKQEVPVYMGG